jgi:hypothetical protein
VPRCPTTATLRIFPGSNDMCQLLCGDAASARHAIRDVPAYLRLPERADGHRP